MREGWDVRREVSVIQLYEYLVHCGTHQIVRTYLYDMCTGGREIVNCICAPKNTESKAHSDASMLLI